MSARHPRPTRTPQELAITWQCASILLGYPDELQRGHLHLVHQSLCALPEDLGAPLQRAAVHLDATPMEELQAAYVETFDNRRRTNLFLTYFAHGDTRKRGVALLRFKQAYLRSGFVLDDSELPDHLCVVLEYAATIDQRLGWVLLLDHRAGLELLRLGLTGEANPWAGAVESVCGTLPPLKGDEVEAVRALAADGPPAEEVGLTPYGTPSFDPALAPGPVDLPTPRLRRAAT